MSAWISTESCYITTSGINPVQKQSTAVNQAANLLDFGLVHGEFEWTLYDGGQGKRLIGILQVTPTSTNAESFEAQSDAKPGDPNITSTRRPEYHK